MHDSSTPNHWGGKYLGSLQAVESAIIPCLSVIIRLLAGVAKRNVSIKQVSSQCIRDFCDPGENESNQNILNCPSLRFIIRYNTSEKSLKNESEVRLIGKRRFECIFHFDNFRKKDLDDAKEILTQ